ncbi:MAG: MATE family efflux transporter [Tumebacillaceae bacterium]
MRSETVQRLPAQRQPISHREYVLLALPLILSALSTPLLGAVDTAVVGQLPDAAYIGGVAVGTLIFNTLYWLLGFLRVSTSGFTSQAIGSNDRLEVLMAFLRPFLLAVVFGCLFVVFQVPIKNAAHAIINPNPSVWAQAEIYYDIRIWGAPFVLINFCINGWLIGVAKVRASLFMQIFMNLLNIALCLFFVLGQHMNVTGVGLATLISEFSATLMGAYLFFKHQMFRGVTWTWKRVLAYQPFMRMLKVNRDLFIRTLCLVSVFTLFTSKGDGMGEVVLAANAILIQMQLMMAYFLDGFAHAIGILVGQSFGQKNRALYERTVKLSLIWGAVSSVVLAGVVVAFGDQLVALFTTLEDVRLAASDYLYWLIVWPLVAFWGNQLTGVFAGATAAASIRDSMALSFAVYLAATWLAVPLMGNDGLWLAFTLFNLGRSVFLWMYLPRLNRSFPV